jgi:glutathione S-transferase
VAELIYHLALRDRWEAPTPDYRWSSVDTTLDEEGFIHCSYADQLDRTFAKYYAIQSEVVLLTIDPDAVPSEIKVENGFPHIYGPLPRDAVIRATPYG